MAIREQKRRQRSFFVYWTNPFTGRRESKSCQTREEAEKLDAFVKYQLKYERESFRREDVETAPATQTLETIIYLYLKDRKLSMENLGKTLYAIKSIVTDYGDTEIDKIDAGLLRNMQTTLLNSANPHAKYPFSIKNSTVRRKMGIVKAAMQWAFKHGYITSPPSFPELPQAKYARYATPTQEEIAQLYRVAPEHLKRVLILGFYFGMRIGQSELFKMTWRDVDLSECVIRIPNADKGSADPWREVPIRQDLLPLLMHWQEIDNERGQEFLIAYKGKPVRKIRTAWRLALQRAGITRYIRPYDLRHGFASEAIAAGVDYGTVAALMGHKSPVMVLRHYQHVKTRQKIEAVEAIPAPPQCVQIDVCKK